MTIFDDVLALTLALLVCGGPVVLLMAVRQALRDADAHRRTTSSPSESVLQRELRLAVQRAAAIEAELARVLERHQRLKDELRLAWRSSHSTAQRETPRTAVELATELQRQVDYLRLRIDALGREHHDALASIREMEAAQARGAERAKTRLRQRPSAPDPGVVPRPGRLSTVLLGGLRHSLALSSRLVLAATPLIPATHRPRYEAEWLAELEYLQRAGSALLGVALRIAATVPATALVLRAQAVPWAAIVAWLRRLEPVFAGLLGGASVFMTAASSLWIRDVTPTRVQLGLAVLASVLSGILVAWQTRKERRPRNEDNRGRE